MTVEPVSAAHVHPVGRAPANGPAFAAMLRDRLETPGTLPTVTFGEMTGVQPAPIEPALPAPPVTVSSPGGGLRWPVRGRITSEFGPRHHPVLGTTRDHDGLDIAAPTGTPVLAAAGGTVTFAGSRGGYGNMVIVAHPNGLETRYAHQHQLTVSAGQSVQAGQRIGSVGSTGMSTGPHLHFEARRGGTPVDPRALLAR